MSLILDDNELAINPNPRVPIVIALDTSGSMTGAKINALNKGVNLFLDTILADEITRFSADIAILSFGPHVNKVLDFGDAENIKLRALSAGGGTPMGAATLEALSMLEDRKKQYKKNAVTYWQPWLVVMTDGAATDGGLQYGNASNKVKEAAMKTSKLIQDKKLIMFSIIIEPGTSDELATFGGRIAPLDGVKFEEFFQWLSQSVSVVSESTPGTGFTLPDPQSWTSIDW